MITITKRAVDEIKLSMYNPDNKGLMVRFAVEDNDKEFQYLMGFDERLDSDIHLESNGIEYLVSYTQKQLLKGMVVDFDELIEDNTYGFIFMNPNDPQYEPPKEEFAPNKKNNSKDKKN